MRRVVSVLIPLLLASLLTSCGSKRLGHVPTSGQEPVTKRATGGFDEETLRQVVVRTSKARRLAEKRPIVIEQLSRKAFKARIQEQLLDDEEPTEDAPKGEAGAAGEVESDPASNPTQALLLGLNLVPPPDQRSKIASADDVLKEQIAAYYDRRRDVVVVPIEAAKDEEARLQQRAVLAHEVHHALQERHFDLPPLAQAASLDQRIARLALIEGDAMVAMGAYLGTELDRPVRRTLMAITETVRKVDKGKIHRQRARQLDQALPVMRETLLFPYREGMLFVTDLYRAGGFDLVDRSYARPPTSTMHILHPQKYLDGIQPSEYGALPSLRGVAIKQQLSLGELVTRVVIERCNEPDVARQVSAGWSGDQMSFGVLPDGAAVTLWLSHWDSDKRAESVVAALNKPTCWTANADGDTAIAASFAIQRRGRRVVLIRGAAPAATAKWMNQLLQVEPREVAPKPLADARIPVRRELPPQEPGGIKGDAYRSDWLGITSTIPKGAMVKLNDGDLELKISWSNSAMTGLLAVSERVVSAAANDRAFDQIYRIVSKINRYHKPTEIVRSSWESPLGKSEVRVWQLLNLRVRAVLVPICAGSGSLLMVQAYQNPAEERILSHWLQSFRWLNGRNLLVCERLDPK